MMQNYAILIIAVLMCFSAKAQVFPPDITCVRGDTIFWEIPNNTCGMADAYYVYASNSKTGPYDKIATIINLNQDFYWHTGSGNQTWYYYLETLAQCPGEIALHSDTIDNQIPDLLPIDFVTVLNNQVTISWTPSDSEEVIGSIIYRVTPTGTIPIDTVFSGNQYVDTNANPTLQPEIFYVVAMEVCENTGIFDEPHFTTHLILGTNACERSISLEWNPYQNWTAGIDQQEIWGSINGSPIELIATVADTTTNFILENVNDGDTYCFYIEAIENTTGFRSRSNETCATIDVVQTASDLMMTNVTVTDDDQVQVDWYWNEDAELMNYQIARQKKGNDSIDILNFDPTTPLVYQNTYIDPVTVGDAGFTYSIKTFDTCGGGQTSTENVSTICLSGTTFGNNTNRLTWTDFELPNATVLGYEIFEKTDSGSDLLDQVSFEETEWMDELNPRLSSEANKCYCVEAIVALSLPDGTQQQVRSRSNTTCVGQSATIFAPNAFTPNGRNSQFKPKIRFGKAVLSYQMMIFDRWGTRLFQSDAIDKGWDGRSAKGQDMPVGAYTYIIRLQQPNGEFIEDKGVFVLLR